MQTGVLKNRLLQATDRKFDPETYGFPTFRALLTALEDVLLSVPNTYPPEVELTGDGLATLTGPARTRPESVGNSSRRVRQDLWDAVMDFSSRRRYVWDSVSMRAVALDPGSEPPTQLVLPTITADEFARMRDEFVNARTTTVSEDEALQLTVWAESRHRTMGLPAPLRPVWNLTLKNEVIRRLDAWFATAGVDPPKDTFEAVPESRKGSDADELRRFVRRCVDQMSEAELQRLPIPAEVAFRVGR